MRPPFSDFREFSVQKVPLFSNIKDMRNIPSETPFSVNFRTLMRTINLTECGDRGLSRSSLTSTKSRCRKGSEVALNYLKTFSLSPTWGRGCKHFPGRREENIFL